MHKITLHHLPLGWVSSVFSDVPVVFYSRNAPVPDVRLDRRHHLSNPSLATQYQSYNHRNDSVTIAVPCPFTSSSAVIGFIGASIGCPMLTRPYLVSPLLVRPRRSLSSSSSSKVFPVFLFHVFAFGNPRTCGPADVCRKEHLPRPLDATKVLDAGGGGRRRRRKKKKKSQASFVASRRP